MSNPLRVVAISMLALLVSAPAALTDVPTSMNVQGVLRNDTGEPVSPGLRIFIFKIFDQPSGGTEIWPAAPGEQHTLATDDNGLWNAVIGTFIPLPEAVFQDSARWLEITVDDGVLPAETLERIKLNTHPYAYRAASAQQADALQGNTLGDLTDLFVDETGDIMTGNIIVNSPNDSTWGGSARVNNMNDGYIPISLFPNTIALVTDVASDADVGKFGLVSLSRGTGGRSIGVYGEGNGADDLNIGLYGAIGFPSATENFSGVFYNGDFWVWNPATPGDSAVRLPNNSISSSEILDEPGMSRVLVSSMAIDDAGTTNIASNSISVPAPGYIVATAYMYAAISGTTIGNVLVGVETGPTTQPTASDRTVFGAGDEVLSANRTRWGPLSVERTYFVDSAGTYTYYLNGFRGWLGGTASVNRVKFLLTYIPGSYDAVAAAPYAGMSMPITGATATLSDPANPKGGDIEHSIVDLRELELRAMRARAEAERTQREWLEAKVRALQPGPKTDR